MRKYLSIFFIFFSLAGSATQYYVKNGGNDSNTGLSDAQAWAYHPWMTGWTGTVTLAPGDIVSMKRGSTWTKANPTSPFMTVGQNGTSGNYITTNSYSTGAKPIINISTASTYQVIRGSSRSFLIFDNLDISHSGKVYSTNIGYMGFMFTGTDASPTHDIIITNCDVHNIPNTGVYCGESGYNIVVGDSTATTTATAVLYSNNIYDIGNMGVSLKGSKLVGSISNYKCIYNYIHEIREGAPAVPSPNQSLAYGVTINNSGTTVATNCWINYNRIVNVPSWTGIDVHGGENIYIQGNYVYNCYLLVGTQAYITSNPATSVLNYCYIEDNILESPQSPSNSLSVFIQCSGNSTSNPVENISIKRNRLFYTTAPVVSISGYGIKLTRCNTGAVEDNLIYNGPSNATTGGMQIGGGNITVKNNWIQNWNPAIYITPKHVIDDLTISGNIIFSKGKGIFFYSSPNTLTDNMYIYNNTILTSNSAASADRRVIDIAGVTVNAGASINIKNNILGFYTILTDGKYIYRPTTITGTFTCDYNLYWNNSYSTPFYSTSLITFAAWKVLGYDAHSPNVSGNLDPLFVNTSGNYSDTADFQLQSISPAIGAGVVVGLFYDFAGNEFLDPPAIGAYDEPPTAPTLVTSIDVWGTGDATTITIDEGTLQMLTKVLPVDATDTTKTWIVTDGTGHATIDQTGLLMAATDGTVTVRAMANDESDIYGEEVITLSNQTPTPGVALPTVVTSTTIIPGAIIAQSNNNQIIDDGGGTITEKGICWGTSANPTTAGDHANCGTGTDSFYYLITGLIAGTTYHVRAYAINSEGTGYGDDEIFDTTDEKLIIQENEIIIQEGILIKIE